MPTRKISDFDLPQRPDWDHSTRPCLDRSHEVPGHMVFSPGIWEHECPSCGRKVTFTVMGNHC